MNVSLVNLKLVVETKLQIELEAWQTGQKKWNVSNQFSESVLESALSVFEEAFMTVADNWQKEGANLQGIAVMDWAYALSEFQPQELDSAWID